MWLDAFWTALVHDDEERGWDLKPSGRAAEPVHLTPASSLPMLPSTNAQVDHGCPGARWDCWKLPLPLLLVAVF